MAVGTLLAGFFMNSFGRLNTIRWCTLPFTIGWFLVATATSYEQILAGRILTGLANRKRCLLVSIRQRAQCVIRLHSVGTLQRSRGARERCFPLPVAMSEVWL